MQLSVNSWACLACSGHDLMMTIWQTMTHVEETQHVVLMEAAAKEEKENFGGFSNREAQQNEAPESEEEELNLQEVLSSLYGDFRLQRGASTSSLLPLNFVSIPANTWQEGKRTNSLQASSAWQRSSLRIGNADTHFRMIRHEAKRVTNGFSSA